VKFKVCTNCASFFTYTSYSFLQVLQCGEHTDQHLVNLQLPYIEHYNLNSANFEYLNYPKYKIFQNVFVRGQGEGRGAGHGQVAKKPGVVSIVSEFVYLYEYEIINCIIQNIMNVILSFKFIITYYGITKLYSPLYTLYQVYTVYNIESRYSLTHTNSNSIICFCLYDLQYYYYYYYNTEHREVIPIF
jgi:hypothetical protein